MGPLDKTPGWSMLQAIDSVAIIGCNVAGIAIAESTLLAGFSTTIIQVTPGLTHLTRRRIERFIEQEGREGRLTRRAVERARSRLRVSADILDVAGSDAVIEATGFSLAVRQTLLRKAEGATGSHAMIAASGSPLQLPALAAHIEAREHFLGLHFFTPAVLAWHCEIYPLSDTKATIVQSCIEFTRALGKEPLVVGDLSRFFVHGRLAARAPWRAA